VWQLPWLNRTSRDRAEVGRSRNSRTWRRLACANAHASALRLDLVARDRIHCRRAQARTRTQVEARVVQWAADGAVHEQTVAERLRVVRVRAGRAHGEDLVAEAREQHGVAMRVAEQHLPVPKSAQRDALGQIAAHEFLGSAHAETILFVFGWSFGAADSVDSYSPG
jgi:hypothetical protein